MFLLLPPVTKGALIANTAFMHDLDHSSAHSLLHPSLSLSLFNELRKSEAKEEKNGFERMTNDDAESHDGLLPILS